MEEIISISALNQYVFCSRRCALMHVEGIWSDNEHTAKGTILHKNADERGYEVIGQAKCLHALPLYSEIYGLNGKAGIVEIHRDEIIPVEYKKGKIISQNQEMRIETNRKKVKNANSTTTIFNWRRRLCVSKKCFKRRSNAVLFITR